MHVTWVVQEKHIEVFLQILMGLCLTEIAICSGLAEVTSWLHLDLSIAKCSSSTIESLKERIAKEWGRVLREVHLGLLSLIQDAVRFTTILTICLILWWCRWPVEVQCILMVLINGIEWTMLIERSCRTQIHIAGAELLTRFVIIEAKRDFGLARLHILRVVKRGETSDWGHEWWLDGKLCRDTSVACCVWRQILGSKLPLHHLALLFHE